MFRPSAIACAVVCAFAQSPLLLVSSAYAQTPQDQQLPITEVSGARLSFRDTSAPYANEVYTRADIEANGASSLVEFLAKASLVGVSSSYGNNLAPNLDIRGFGIEQGTRAVGIVVDGRPITSIDSSNAFLTQIPLSSIKSIEVTRGYGAAARGEGAVAGIIVITTEVRDGAEVRAGVGSNQLREGGLSVAQTFGIAQLAASLDTTGTDGSGQTPTGETDSNFSRNQQASLGINITPRLNVKLSAKATDTQLKYPNPISVAQFRDSPKLLAGGVQPSKFELEEYDADLTWKASDAYTVRALATTKQSLNAVFSNLETKENYFDFSVDRRSSGQVITAGVSVRDAEVDSSSLSGVRYGETSRDTLALFLLGSKQFGRWQIAGGVRAEEARFETNEGGVAEGKDRYINLDSSVSYRHSNTALSYLALSRAVQAPNIDSFFNGGFGGQRTLNASISPARAVSLTLGHNTVLGSHSLKGSVFYTRLRNELFYDPNSFTNTNIDRSHKYGLELQDQWRVARGLDVNLAGSYVRAVIDEESGFSDKELPGVPKLNLKAGLSWSFAQSLVLDANTSFKSGAFRFGDFSNNGVNRQITERSTDLQLRYLRGAYALAAGVANVFDQQNGINADTSNIYPTLIERTIFVRGSARF